MVRNDIKYERLHKYEDSENSSVAIRLKDGKNKWINLIGIYRQWMKKGEFNFCDTEGIRHQVNRLKAQTENIDKMVRENKIV